MGNQVQLQESLSNKGYFERDRERREVDGDQINFARTAIKI